LRGLVETFSIIHDSIWVHCDSQSAIHLAKDHRYHMRMKHIDVRYHKIRQCVVDDKVIDLVKISMKKNPADMVTKTIPVKKFRASLNFNKFLKGKLTNGRLRGSHVKSQNGRESKANEVETNFIGGTQ